MASFNSSLTAAIDGLEDLLIASATFLGSFTAEGLTEQQIRDTRIFLEALTNESDDLICKLPAAAILEGDHRYSLLSHGPGLQSGASGSIKLLLARAAEYRDDHKQSRRDFVGWSTQIVDEIMTQVMDGDTWYQFASAQIMQVAVRPPKKDRADARDDWWWCSYEFMFGFDE